MFLNAIIFEKLKSVFNQLNTVSGRYFLTFSPITTSFNNQDFNFLDTTTPVQYLSDAYENQMAFAHLANAVIRRQDIYELNPDSSLPENYKKIFDHAKLIESSLSDADKQKYRDAKSVLYQDDGLTKAADYEKYSSYKAKYEGLVQNIQDLSDKIMANPDDKDSLSKKQELETLQNIAFNDWLIDGEKDKIENALKIVSSISERSAFVSQWNQEYLKLQSEISKVTTVGSNIDFLPVSCLPNDLYKYEYSGWKKIVMEEKEIADLENSAKTSLTDDFYNTYDSSGLSYSKVEFEYIFVTVLRNWFKPNLVNSQFWNFSDQQVVSDESDLNKGLLPSYIEKFLFIRRVYAYNKNVNPKENEIMAEEKIPQTYIFRNIAKNLKTIDLVQPKIIRTSKFKMISQNKLFSTPVLRKVKLENTITNQPIINRFDKNLFRRKILFPIPVINVVEQKTKFQFSLIFKDELGNYLTDINILLQSSADGSTYSTETDNDGKVVFNDMEKGDYTISIQREELYEDSSFSLNLSEDVSKEFIIKKRQNPYFDMILLGAVNYRLPNLPNPLPGYVFS